MGSEPDEYRPHDEITRLEWELNAARTKLKGAIRGTDPDASSINEGKNTTPASTLDTTLTLSAPSHALLLLSDSALPLGSFAFSSGLESYLAHHPPRPPPPLYPFLSLSLASVASTTLPYLLAASKDPSSLPALDDTLDACTLCLVARRASIAQGRALLTLWERAFRETVDASLPASRALAGFAKELRGGDEAVERVQGHYAPLWALVTAAMGIGVQESAYAFLFNHAKAVVSAAVRASVMGPYQAQGVLAGKWLREEITRSLKENWEVEVVSAGQVVPLMDLWVGRHEMLYSRIFNS